MASGLDVGCRAALFGQHNVQWLVTFIDLGQQPKVVRFLIKTQISDFSLETRSGVLRPEFQHNRCGLYSQMCSSGKV